MNAAAALAAGWTADAVAGDPRRVHPVAAFGDVAAWLECRWHADRRAAGLGYAAVLVAAPTVAVLLASRRLHGAAGTLLAAVTVWAALGARTLATEAQRVRACLGNGDLAGARRRLPALVGRDPAGLDADEITRAVVESVAENTADAVVAPLVYGALFGPAAVVLHRCANTLDAMVGHRSPRYERFGWAAARLDDTLGWLPARVTAALGVVLAPVVGGDPRAALAAWLRDGGNHPSPNAGRAEAAFAGALDRTLGGVNRYGSAVERRGPLGEGPRPHPDDIDRAVRLSRAVGGAALLLACVTACGRRGR